MNGVRPGEKWRRSREKVKCRVYLYDLLGKEYKRVANGVVCVKENNWMFCKLK